LPFDQFRQGGKIDSDSGKWICGGCNRCPDCGLSLGNGQLQRHDCLMPKLEAALVVELDSREKKLLAWMASSLDRCDAAALIALLERAVNSGGESIDLDERWEVVE
jgi:hypothetical protein